MPEILPPPTPDNEFEDQLPSEAQDQPGVPEERNTEGSASALDQVKIRRPSTIFHTDVSGERSSPWGPPTRSMTKKKGWAEPEKPAVVKPPKQEIKKIIAGANELFNLFDRRNKGERISKTVTEWESAKNVNDDFQQKPKFKDTDIGGNIHIRVNFDQTASLFVNIKQADDLVTKNKNKSCNPYAVVTLLGDYKVFKTKVIGKTQSPVWHETFEFALPLKFLQTTAVLVVVYNKHGENVEEFLGEVHISLADYKHFKVIDGWYTLEDLRGEDTKFDGYKELQKVLRSLKTKAPMTLPDTLRQDELRKNENYSSY